MRSSRPGADQSRTGLKSRSQRRLSRGRRRIPSSRGGYGRNALPGAPAGSTSRSTARTPAAVQTCAQKPRTGKCSSGSEEVVHVPTLRVGLALELTYQNGRCAGRCTWCAGASRSRPKRDNCQSSETLHCLQWRHRSLTDITAGGAVAAEAVVAGSGP